jgi:multimeric flavodoxin WrbA
MKLLMMYSNPHRGGLGDACYDAAKRGALEAQAELIEVQLNDMKISNCLVCNDRGRGWGICHSEHICKVKDDFRKLHGFIKEMDAMVVVTPVYWGGMAEPAKAFFDRLRRCEATNRGHNNIEKKPVLSVASAGGSGGGTLECLTYMQMLFNHMGADCYDFVGINQRTKAHKLNCIYESTREMMLWLKKEKSK